MRLGPALDGPLALSRHWENGGSALPPPNGRSRPPRKPDRDFCADLVAFTDQ